MNMKLDALPTDAVIGDYVSTPYGQTGRVYQVHRGCPESRAWFDGQLIPMDENLYREGRWLSVLCHNGGSVVFPDTSLTIIEPIEGFTNNWANFYFGSR